MTNCNEINIEAERLKSIFGKCYNLKALDLRDVVDLIESVNACSNGQFELKTINGESLFGSGNIIVTADVDGTETKIQQGPGILISGSGSIGSPYVITSKVDPADGSETKINQGSNISIGGTGTSSDPYVINAIMPSSEAQVNSDWSAISGPAEILNKPEIPLAQVNADWNAVSGITMILNKPNTLNTNLGYVQSEFGGEVTSSNGTSATIPLVSDEFPGLVSKEMLDALGNDLNNIKLEFEISMPANETNEGFATSINTREFIEITGNQIPTFKAIKIDGEDSKIFYVEILGRGKGGYGVDGYQLSSEEVRFTSFNLTGGNIEDLPGTQIIDLGINSTDVVSVINSRIPNLIIQGQEDGYVLIKGTFNGTVYKEYLWIGEGGIYGEEIGASKASYSDLKELTIESVVRATSTSSGIVKTNLTVEDPVVYLKETSDLLLNEKEDKANKQNSLTVDGTGIKYPTVDSVVGGLATKANISGQIFTGAISATNISGTNTGDETTLSIQTKRPLKTLDGVSIEGVGDIIIPTKAHALTHELGGTDVIHGENLSVNVIPPTNNYSPVTSTLKGYLQGIDQTLGSVQSTLVSGTTIKTIEGQSILGSGNIDITKSDVGLPLADNTSDASKSVLSSTKLTTPRSINGVNFDGTSNITINAVDSTPRIAVSEKAQANGVATLGSDGKVPNNQMPALAISETFPVSSQAAMLALTAADQGDIAIRSDINKSFILRVSPSSVLANWSELLSPTGAVSSVNGQVGVVTLTTTNIAEGSNLYYTEARVSSNPSVVANTAKISNATHTGDATGSTALTLATVNSNVGTFGNASNSTTQTVNAKGLTTAISNVPIQIAESQVTGLVSDLAGKYSTSNPAGYISSFTETDPTVPVYSKSLSAFSVIKTSTDALYEPIISTKNTAFNKNFGTTAGTVAGGNDSRILNGQTAFGWGNHAGLYPTYNGTGATGTWPIGISGSATLWNGQTYNNGGIAGTMTYVMGYDNTNNRFAQATQAQTRSFLGLGSNAYTSTAYLPLRGYSAISANTFITSGIDSNDGTGGTFPYSSILTMRTADTGAQINIDNYSSNIRVRGFYSNGANFGSWRNLWHDGNFNPANYLPLSGGNLSGNLGIGTSDIFTAPNNSVLGFAQGSVIQGRSGFPQLSLSSNIDGDYYTATYKTSNPAVQLVLDGLGGGAAIKTAVSGTVGSAISWIDRLVIANNGKSTFSSSVTASMFYAGSSLWLNSDASDGHIIGRAGKGLRFYTNDGNSNPLSLSTNGSATFASSVTATIGNFSDKINVVHGPNSDYTLYEHPGVQSWRTRLTTDNTSSYVIGNDLGGTFANKIFSLANSGEATFSSSVTASGFFQSSDRRLKTILKRDGDVAYFTWKDKRDTKQHIGYIAQEMRKQFPDQVQKNDDGYLSVSYIEILVAKNRDLERRIEKLEKLISKISKNGI